MFDKRDNRELTYDAEGEAVIGQMLLDSYHAGHIEQNQTEKVNVEL